MNLNIDNNDLVAIICEGKVEKNIIERLLEDKCLLFDYDQLIDNKVLYNNMKKASEFTNKYLTLGIKQKIKIFIVCDKQIPFNIKEPYNHQVSEIIYVLTRPEIEILMIHELGLYSDFSKQKDKPSLFLKKHIGTNVKSESFVDEFYDKYDLLKCIKTYNEKCSNSSEFIGLYDLLNVETKREIDRVNNK